MSLEAKNGEEEDAYVRKINSTCKVLIRVFFVEFTRLFFSHN